MGVETPITEFYISVVILKPIINCLIADGVFLYICGGVSSAMADIGGRIKWFIAGVPAVCCYVICM